MRIRTTLSLAGRAVGAAVIGLGTLGGLSVALAMLGGVSIGAFIVVLVGPETDPVPVMIGGVLVIGLVLTGIVLADGVSISAFIITAAGLASFTTTLGESTLGVGFLIGTVLTVLLWISGVWGELRRSRARLLRKTEPIDHDGNGRVAASTTRLAAQFDLPMPELRIHPASTPIACTTTRDGDPVLVVSDGLLTALSDAELEAVLAHELAHIANGDLRLMTWALVPLLTSEGFYEGMRDEDDFDPFVLSWLVIGWLLVGSSTLGVGLFSRGREFAADRAAVAATGEPGALAAALERLDSATAERPPADLRTHTRSVDAMSVLPTLDPERDGGGGIFATHPATERRLERLRRLAAD